MEDKSVQSYARLTGFLYLLILGLTTVSGQMADALHVKGDFARTAASIRDGEIVYRTGLVLELAAAALVVLLAWSTFKVLQIVDRDLALLAMLWRVGEAVLGAVYTIFAFIGLAIYTGAVVGPAAEMEALAGLLRLGVRHGFLFAVLYFSLGSVLFFSLLLRSRLIPRPLAGLGLFASASVTLYGLAQLILPRSASALGMAGWAPILAAEFLVGLWLTIKGVNLAAWRGRSR